MPKKPAVAVRGVDDVNVSPYEWTRGLGKRDLGLGASRVFMRVVTVWASPGWAHGEGKGESESKGDSEHPSWSSGKIHSLPTSLVRGLCVYISNWPSL